MPLMTYPVSVFGTPDSCNYHLRPNINLIKIANLHCKLQIGLTMGFHIGEQRTINIFCSLYWRHHAMLLSKKRGPRFWTFFTQNWVKKHGQMTIQSMTSPRIDDVTDCFRESCRDEFQ